MPPLASSTGRHADRWQPHHEKGASQSQLPTRFLPPAKDDTFKWILCTSGGTFCGNVYSDGPRLDGPTQLLARNDWAFVVIDFDGNLIAATSGIPPDRIEDIPTTEA